MRRFGHALTVTVLITGGAWMAPAAADIWKRVDESGVTHFTNRPEGGGWTLVMRTSGFRGARAPGAGDRNRRLYTPLIDRASREVGIDRTLVHALVRAESSYDPRAISSKGAVGLMQLMPGTAARYGVVDRNDPEQNVRGGLRYLRDLLIQFEDVTLALAAYNAGENAVVRYGNSIPPFPETQEYVRRVLAFYQEKRANGAR
jgi:soluble lytic murein transglycosylase-like protein